MQHIADNQAGPDDGDLHSRRADAGVPQGGAKVHSSTKRNFT